MTKEKFSIRKTNRGTVSAKIAVISLLAFSGMAQEARADSLSEEPSTNRQTAQEMGNSPQQGAEEGAETTPAEADTPQPTIETRVVSEIQTEYLANDQIDAGQTVLISEGEAAKETTTTTYKVLTTDQLPENQQDSYRARVAYTIDNSQKLDSDKVVIDEAAVRSELATLTTAQDWARVFKESADTLSHWQAVAPLRDLETHVQDYFRDNNPSTDRYADVKAAYVKYEAALTYIQETYTDQELATFIKDNLLDKYKGWFEKRETSYELSLRPSARITDPRVFRYTITDSGTPTFTALAKDYLTYLDGRGIAYEVVSPNELKVNGENYTILRQNRITDQPFSSLTTSQVKETFNLLTETYRTAYDTWTKRYLNSRGLASELSLVVNSSRLTEEDKTWFETQVASLPEAIKKNLAKVVIEDRTDSVVGASTSHNNLITLNYAAMGSKEQLLKEFLHELAHVIDFNAYRISRSKDFYGIDNDRRFTTSSLYNTVINPLITQEDRVVAPDYAKDEKEAFAEFFSDYLMTRHFPTYQPVKFIKIGDKILTLRNLDWGSTPEAVQENRANYERYYNDAAAYSPLEAAGTFFSNLYNRLFEGPTSSETVIDQVTTETSPGRSQVYHIGTQSTSIEERTAFTSREEDDFNLPIGSHRLVQSGHDGIERVTTTYTLVDTTTGELRETRTRETLQEGREEIIAIGRKPLDDASADHEPDSESTEETLPVDSDNSGNADSSTTTDNNSTDVSNPVTSDNNSNEESQNAGHSETSTQADKEETNSTNPVTSDNVSNEDSQDAGQAETGNQADGDGTDSTNPATADNASNEDSQNADQTETGNQTDREETEATNPVISDNTSNDDSQNAGGSNTGNQADSEETEENNPATSDNVSNDDSLNADHSETGNQTDREETEATNPVISDNTSNDDSQDADQTDSGNQTGDSTTDSAAPVTSDNASNEDSLNTGEADSGNQTGDNTTDSAAPVTSDNNSNEESQDTGHSETSTQADGDGTDSTNPVTSDNAANEDSQDAGQAETGNQAGDSTTDSAAPVTSDNTSNQESQNTGEAETGNQADGEETEENNPVISDNASNDESQNADQADSGNQTGDNTTDSAAPVTSDNASNDDSQNADQTDSGNQTGDGTTDSVSPVTSDNASNEDSQNADQTETGNQTDSEETEADNPVTSDNVSNDDSQDAGGSNTGNQADSEESEENNPATSDNNSNDESQDTSHSETGTQSDSEESEATNPVTSDNVSNEDSQNADQADSGNQTGDSTTDSAAPVTSDNVSNDDSQDAGQAETGNQTDREETEADNPTTADSTSNVSNDDSQNADQAETDNQTGDSTTDSAAPVTSDNTSNQESQNTGEADSGNQTGDSTTDSAAPVTSDNNSNENTQHSSGSNTSVLADSTLTLPVSSNSSGHQDGIRATTANNTAGLVENISDMPVAIRTTENNENGSAAGTAHTTKESQARVKPYGSAAGRTGSNKQALSNQVTGQGDSETDLINDKSTSGLIQTLSGAKTSVADQPSQKSNPSSSTTKTLPQTGEVSQQTLALMGLSLLLASLGLVSRPKKS